MKKLLPDIFLFNPTCEYAIANGNANWQSNQVLQKMESDLSAIQLYFADEKDFILVDKIPLSGFISTLHQLDLKLPDFILKKDAIKYSYFAGIPKNKLLPWGWSPAAHKLLSPLKESCSDEFKTSPVFNWQPEHKKMYSKKFAKDVLQQLVSQVNSPIFLPQKLVPEICTSKPEVEMLIKKWNKIMVKAPWSSSGRGLQPVTKTPVHTKVWEKILGTINDQGYVIVEPLLEKVLDYSFQFTMSKGKIEFLGISNFVTDKKGQYLGNNLNGLPENIEQEVVEFHQHSISEILHPLILILENSILSRYYEGNFGVDTLIFSDENNRLRINPCLELNIRQNMGLLSLYLEKMIVPEKKGVYRMFYQQGTTFNEFSEEMRKKYPLVISDQKIESGFFALTEDLKDTLFGSYLLV